MEKTVIELFAGVGGFRVGLNDIHGFNEETGRAIGILYGQISGSHLQRFNMLMNAIVRDLDMKTIQMKI